MQSTLDIIKTRTKRMYLSHPFMWKFGSLYESMALLGFAKKKMVERDLTDTDTRTISDFNEEVRIAKNHKFAKLTAHGYEMLKGVPMDFPDNEFEKRYAERKLNMTTRRISSWKKRRIYKT